VSPTRLSRALSSDVDSATSSGCCGATPADPLVHPGRQRIGQIPFPGRHRPEPLRRPYAQVDGRGQRNDPAARRQLVQRIGDLRALQHPGDHPVGVRLPTGLGRQGTARSAPARRRSPARRPPHVAGQLLGGREPDRVQHGVGGARPRDRQREHGRHRSERPLVAQGLAPGDADGDLPDHGVYRYRVCEGPGIPR